MTNRMEMKGSEFLDRIAKGYRDFQNIVLVEGDLERLPGYEDVRARTESGIMKGKEILLRDRLKLGYGDGMNFTGARIKGLVAPGMYFHGAIFDGAELDSVVAPGAHFDYCRFRGTKIRGLAVQGGSLSCGVFENAIIDGLGVRGALTFENGFNKTVLLNVEGLRGTQHFSTSGLHDVIVDSETYEAMCDVFPKHAPLVARDIPPGTVLDDGTVIPDGSKLINGEYYLTALAQKAGII